MSGDVARLQFVRPLRAIRALVEAPAGAQAEPVRRLLELRDVAIEQQQAREATQACAEALRQQLASVRSTVAARLDQVAGAVTELALAVAAEVVGDALERRGVDPLPMVRRCLAACVTSGERIGFSVRVSPKDRELLASLAELQDVVLVADPEFARGRVRVDTAAGSVEYDPLEVLRRMSDELRRELAQCP